MATTQVNFQVLDVGQGSGNFIEIYDGSELKHTVLIDLGTTSGKTQSPTAIAYITDKLNSMKDASGDAAPKIDLLLLTHSDTDHINLMWKLLKNFPATGDGALNIEMVRYGGDSRHYKKGANGKNILVELGKYCSDIRPPGAAEMGVDKSGKWVRFWEEAGVEVYLVAANVPVVAGTASTDGTTPPSKKRKREAEPDAYALNTRSLVNIVEWDGYWYATAGDATATTLVECNKVLAKATSPLPTTFMLTVPHHGSKNTIFDLKVATDEPSDEAVKVVKSFAKKISARTLCASANKTGHHHPSLFVSDIFVKYTDTHIYWSDPLLADDRHLYTAWVDVTITGTGVDPAYPSTWEYASLETEQNYFTTLYTRPGIIPIANYVYPPIPASELITDEPTGTIAGARWNFYMTKTEMGISRHPGNALADTTPLSRRQPVPKAVAMGAVAREAGERKPEGRRLPGSGMPESALQPAAPSLRRLRAFA